MNGMEDKKPLLSICIPTYNGASSSLKEVLEYTTRCADRYPEEIEIIVSDNCSTDATPVLIEKYKNRAYFRAYHNDTNLGFNGNMLKLTEEYARGDFFWLVGDDDIINPNALQLIISTLRENEIDYLSLWYNYIYQEDFSQISFVNSFSIHCDSFADVIDVNCRRGNSFGSFMSSAIVRRKMFNEVPKDIIENKFDIFYNVWPNAYINAIAFNNKNCAYIPETVLYSIRHQKEWAGDDNMYKLCSQYNVEMYYFFLSLGINDNKLRRTHIRVLYDYLFNSINRILKRKKISKGFLKMSLQSFKFPVIWKTIFVNYGRLALSIITRRKYQLIDVN